MHQGHMVPFTLIQYVSMVVDGLIGYTNRSRPQVAPGCVRRTPRDYDDGRREDHSWGKKKRHTLEKMRCFTRGDAKDILAVGFDLKKAFPSSELDSMGRAF